MRGIHRDECEIPSGSVFSGSSHSGVTAMKRLVYISLYAAAFSACSARDPMVKFAQTQDGVDVLIGNACVTTWLFRPDMAKPVLYPVRTRSGLVLTRRFPLEKAEGESSDHPHHTGLFFAFDGVNGMQRDRFWRAVKPPPQIRPVKITELKEGRGKGALSVTCDWRGDSGRTVLVEDRRMVFSAAGNGYAIDFTIRLTAADSAVVFEDTKEGLFAVRVADWMNEKDGSGRYLNSRGGETETGVWGERAEWVRLEAEKGEDRAGIAIFSHPETVNHPVYWQARAYGLFSADPLGQLDFQKALKIEDPRPFGLVLQPGQSALFRFLFFVYDGSMTKDELDAVYQVYSARKGDAR
jgi:hypothetical protein